jgi:hypothetical protein
MRRSQVVLLASLLALIAFAVPAGASAKTTWLCNPVALKKDPCRPGLGTATFSPTGAPGSVETPAVPRRPKIDCFYVYPTVSGQSTRLATKRKDPEIRSIALYQAARYSQLCRVFAPVYRQVTIAGLSKRSNSNINSYPTYNPAGYTDVKAAWAEFMKLSKGRPFVVIGHSQGTFLLRKFLRDVVDGDPAMRKRLVSAVLLGGNVLTAAGRDVGGDFQHLPACRSATQTGCVIAFSTFDETPPADSLFGRTTVPGREVLCTNPAALGGGPGVLTPVYPSQPFAPGTLIAAGITLLGVKQPTSQLPWVAIPRSYQGECAKEDGASFLRITPLDGAPDFKASPTPQWGLHLTDANIALQNLIDVVRSQAAALAKTH